MLLKCTKEDCERKGQWLDEEEFYTRAHGKHGRHTWCKRCCCAQTKMNKNYKTTQKPSKTRAYTMTVRGSSFLEQARKYNAENPTIRSGELRERLLLRKGSTERLVVM